MPRPRSPDGNGRRRHGLAGAMATGRRGTGLGGRDIHPGDRHRIRLRARLPGVRAAWRDADSVYAEVALPDDHVDAAKGFAIHPALFDASLHGGLDWLDSGDGASAGLPFSWSGVQFGQPGLARVRVRIGSAGASALRIDVAGEDGVPVVSVAKLAFRPVDQTQIQGRSRHPARSTRSTGLP
ncbi:polyketide synthase dehydratase domain-containing protein [Streptomyces sp. M10(2022)]